MRPELWALAGMRGRWMLLVSLSLGWPLAARAQGRDTPAADASIDRYVLSAHAETHATLFRRALLPGSEGALVEENTLLPLSEYVALRVVDLDTALGSDTLDLELSAYGQLVPGTLDGERRLDGDVQAANVRIHRGPVSVKVGRQMVAGGAARFARFDGALGELELGKGLDARAYFGLSVLPRWDQRPSYRYLGAVSSEVMRSPDAYADLTRLDHFLFGGRLGFASDDAAVGLSFHEAHETGGLAHRNLALDGRAALEDATEVRGVALVDLDSRRVADLRVSVGTTPVPALDASVELSHSEPSLLLSRQSVLSVFNTTSFEEALVVATIRTPWPVVLDGEAGVEVYSEGGPGARARGTARFTLSRAHHAFALVSYERLLAPDNGYQAVRSSLSSRLVRAVTGTLDLYEYYYDRAIADYRSSSVFAATLRREFDVGLDVMAGASLSHTPYASLEAQAELRLGYAFERHEKGGAVSSRRLEPLVLLLLVVVLGAAVLAACSDPRPARFPHRTHLAEVACGKPGQPSCLNCNSCHTASAVDRAHHLPSKTQCDRCHHDDEGDVERVLAVLPAQPYGSITFDHSKHLAMPELRGQCVPCHAGVVEDEKPLLPPMSTCLGCHQHRDEWNAGTCVPCHEQEDLVKLMPATFLRHDGDFARRHGEYVPHEGKLCQACHGQSDCDDCHDTSQVMRVELRHPDELERHFVHRADFLTRHALEASASPTRCLACHEVSSCDGCHAARGVSAGLLMGRSPHPPGWVGNDTRLHSQHGIEARRDILACAGCHDQGPATNCIRCHKVGGYGGNPHPPGTFRTSRGVFDGMCRYCHG